MAIIKKIPNLPNRAGRAGRAEPPSLAEPNLLAIRVEVLLGPFDRT